MVCDVLEFLLERERDEREQSECSAEDKEHANIERYPADSPLSVSDILVELLHEWPAEFFARLSVLNDERFVRPASVAQVGEEKKKGTHIAHGRIHLAMGGQHSIATKNTGQQLAYAQQMQQGDITHAHMPCMVCCFVFTNSSKKSTDNQRHDDSHQ